MNNHWGIKCNTAHTRIIEVGIYFWELECQVLSNIYSSYCICQVSVSVLEMPVVSWHNEQWLQSAG